MFEVQPPSDRPGLQLGLKDLHAEITAALEELPQEIFLRPQGQYWSPADHLRHLNKSVRPVAKALALPKASLLPFGVSLRGSRSYQQVVEIYHQALANGAQAGSYGPSQRTDDLDDRAWRELILERWRTAGADLDSALGKWSEGALDRHRLPHPVLGKLTVREMLFFTLYHNRHHALRIFERMAEPAAVAGTSA